jgi:diguanylate cyclase (GGDEF)-like protein/PAS domain S-box-containing protein
MSSISRELLEEIVALSAESLLVVDASGPEAAIVYANPAYESTSGYTSDELAGSNWLNHAAMEDEAPELHELRQRLAGASALELSLPFLRKDGEIWLGSLRLKPLKAGDGGRRLWLVQHQNREIAATTGAELLKRVLTRARHKLANLEKIDPVTGLMSRSALDFTLRRELAQARRNGASLSLMLFAVPELDIYRQTFGDNAADSCLRMIGAQISGTFRRATDLCARFDRDELAAVIRGQDEAQARQLVTLVERKARNLGLHNPRGRMGKVMFVRGTFVQAQGEDLDGLLARARAALAADNTAALPLPAAAASAG